MSSDEWGAGEGRGWAAPNSLKALSAELPSRVGHRRDPEQGRVALLPLSPSTWHSPGLGGVPMSVAVPAAVGHPPFEAFPSLLSLDTGLISPKASACIGFLCTLTRSVCTLIIHTLRHHCSSYPYTLQSLP